MGLVGNFQAKVLFEQAESETKGETTMEKADTLEVMVDSFTPSECDLFVELCLESRQKKAQVEAEIHHIVKTL